MGNCVSDKKKSTRSSDSYPEDLIRFTPAIRQKLTKLSFEGLLSNIKVKNLHKSIHSLKFVIQKWLNIDLLQKNSLQSDNQINWKEKVSFNLQIDDYELRTIFLIIQGFDENNVLLDNIKINLFYIVTGPYHHELVLFKDQNTRVLFDIKICQFVEISVFPEIVDIQLNSQLPGQEFNYSFQVLKCNKSSSYFNSEPSQSIKTASFLQKDNFRQMSKQEQCPSPTRSRKTASKLIKVQKNTKIRWSDSINSQMSNFTIKLKALQIFKCSIRFILWRILGGQNNQECLLFACHQICLNTMFQNQIISRFDVDQRQGQFRKDLQSHGKVVGSSFIKLKVCNLRFYQQLTGCTRSQDGIISMSALFKNYGTDKLLKNETINKICEITDEIIKKNIELGEINIYLSQVKLRKIKAQMLGLFQKLHQKLKLTHEESCSFSRVDEKQNLIQEQLKLLGICDKLYIFIQEDDICFSDQCWDIFVLILTRGQFLLKNIGIYDSNLEQSKQELLSKSKSVALKYQKIMFQVLILALNFSTCGSRSRAKFSTDRFKAICYMRIPIFREKLLEVIQQTNQPEFEQTNRLTVQFQNDMNTQRSQQVFMVHLDWDNFLYHPLKQNEVNIKLMKDLRQKLNNHGWFQVIAKKTGQYFRVIRNCIIQMVDFKQKCQIDSWYNFPGYNKLIKSLLREIQNTPILSHSTQLELASLNVLCNQRLINPIMKIVLEKTNYMESTAVEKVLDLLNYYFEYLTKKTKMLPITFNYLLFFKGLKIILQKVFSFRNIAQSLLLIYNFYDKFGIQFKKILTKYLLGSVFFKLFLNWSDPVRQIFHHLMILKIQPSINFLNENNINQISILYQNAIQKVYHQLQIYKEKKKQQITSKFEKELYKIMKRKLNSLKKKSFPSQVIVSTKIKQRKYSVCFQSINYDPILQQMVLNNPQQQQLKQVQIRGFFHQNNTNNTKINKINQHRLKTFNSNNQNQKSSNCLIERIAKNRKYYFYGKQDFNLGIPDKNELNCIEIAVRRFKEIIQKIQNIIKKTGELPVIPLSLNMTIDAKDFIPSTLNQQK